MKIVHKKKNLPKALAKQLAVVAIVTGSEPAAATAAFAAVDRLRDCGSINTKLEPAPASRTPVERPVSRDDLIAHCIFCGAKFARWP